MPNYCIECWKNLDCEKYDAEEYILSKEPQLCECCKKVDYVVVGERLYPLAFELFLFPYRYFFIFLCYLIKLILLPYFIYKYIKDNNSQ